MGPSQGAIGFLAVRQSAGEIVRFPTQARSQAAGQPAGARAKDLARPPQAPRPHGAGLADARRPGPCPGLITRNRSAGTRRQAASERPRPCPLAGGPQQRPRGAAGSRPFPPLRGKPACPRATARPQPTSEVAPGAYLVILKNDFGWDFLANDLAEDRVATRPGGLSLSDLICHRGLPPARPSEKLGRREEPGERTEGGSARPSVHWDRCSRGRAVLRVRVGDLRCGCGGRVGARGKPPRETRREGGPRSPDPSCCTEVVLPFLFLGEWSY